VKKTFDFTDLETFLQRKEIVIAVQRRNERLSNPK
jgi:hypothetical protein